MTLKQHYNVNKKSKLKRLKGLTFLLFVILIYFCFYSSFARYEGVLDSYAELDIANWSFKINGEKLTNTSTSFTNLFVLVPTTNINPDNPNKIQSDQEGYFEFTIDPTDTEVSFRYEITLDFARSVLPDSFYIHAFSVIGDSLNWDPDGNYGLTEDANTISGGVYIYNKDEGDKKFGSADILTIKFHWVWYYWADEPALDTTEYKIFLSVKLMQWFEPYES